MKYRRKGSRERGMEGRKERRDGEEEERQRVQSTTKQKEKKKQLQVLESNKKNKHKITFEKYSGDLRVTHFIYK